LISYFDGHSPRNSSLSPYLCVSYLCMSWAFPSGNYSLYFLLEYIHFIWRSHCDNSKQAYIVHFILYISPPQPLPAPLQAIARGFIVLCHIGIWSLSTIFSHLHLFCSPPPKVSLHIVPIL
jgi:hypothetical protein